MDNHKCATSVFERYVVRTCIKPHFQNHKNLGQVDLLLLLLFLCSILVLLLVFSKVILQQGVIKTRTKKLISQK